MFETKFLIAEEFEKTFGFFDVKYYNKLKHLLFYHAKINFNFDHYSVNEFKSHEQ